MQLALSFEDRKRIGRQLAAVRDLMLDGRWRTVQEIARVVPGAETALSARVRDLKNVLGLKTASRRVRPGSGLWEFRVVTEEMPHV